MLSEPEQTLAHALSVMRDFDLDAAEAVGGAAGRGDVVELLTRLVDKSLLVADHDGRDTRYRFLETVRQFLLARLQRSGEMHEVRQRHLQRVLALAERFAPHLASREGPAHLAELQANRFSLYFELGGHLAHGDRWTEGRTLNTLGAAHSLSDPVGSRELLARSVALGRESGDDWAVGDGIKMTTVAWYAQHDDDGVQASLAELRRVGEHLGSRFFLAWQQAMVGFFARDRGDLEAAATALALAEAHSRYVGDPSTGGFVECWSAGLDMDLGRFESARVRLEHLLATAAAAGSELAIPEALYAMAQWRLAHGEAAAAKDLVEERVDVMFEYGLLPFGGLLLLALSAAERMSGDTPAALRALDRAAEHTSGLGNEYLDALLLAERGRTALAEGHRSKAEGHLHAALATHVRLGARPAAVRALETLVTIAALDESDAESVRVLSAVESYRNQMGLARGPVDAREHAALLDALRERLADAFDDEWEAAQAVPFADCVEYVTRMRGQRKRPSVGWDSLTPTELRVAALVAEGLSNPQIGSRMFISRGTAKVHLAHIFAKIGLTSRAQLAVMAAERSQRPT